uniref:Protein sleepless n=1 Tax=Ditylenchus dipsaci TaxID=166011 RepID=A0A915EBC9_9BILA
MAVSKSLLSTLLVAIYLFASSQAQAPTTTKATPKAAPAGGIKCYQCNSDSEKDCSSSDESVLDPFIKTCPKLKDGTFAGKEANSCRKVLQNVVDSSNVVRECSYTGDEPLDGKRRTGNKGITLYIYQCFNEETGKPCNSSSSLGVTLLAMLLSVSTLLMMNKL